MLSSADKAITILKNFSNPLPLDESLLLTRLNIKTTVFPILTHLWICFIKTLVKFERRFCCAILPCKARNLRQSD